MLPDLIAQVRALQPQQPLWAVPTAAVVSRGLAAAAPCGEARGGHGLQLHPLWVVPAAALQANTCSARSPRLPRVLPSPSRGVVGLFSCCKQNDDLLCHYFLTMSGPGQHSGQQRGKTSLGAECSHCRVRGTAGDVKVAHKRQGRAAVKVWGA